MIYRSMMYAIPFEQDIPDGEWSLSVGDRTTPRLVYSNNRGSSVQVPNVPYNQPIEWRIETMEFYADCADEEALRLLQLRHNERAEARYAAAERHRKAAAVMRNSVVIGGHDYYRKW